MSNFLRLSTMQGCHLLGEFLRTVASDTFEIKNDMDRGEKIQSISIRS